MRCFVAVDLDEALADRLGALQGELKQAGLRARWVDPGKMHLTLKFLGEIADWRIEAVSAVVAGVAAECHTHDIEIGGLGVFPPRGAARVIWVGVTDGSGGLQRCQAMCEERLEAIGIPREGRAFSPHLTLARNDSPRESERIRGVIERHGALRLGAQRVERIVLYESVLGKGGAVYRVVSGHEFGG